MWGLPPYSRCVLSGNFYLCLKYVTSARTGFITVTLRGLVTTSKLRLNLQFGAGQHTNTRQKLFGVLSSFADLKRTLRPKRVRMTGLAVTFP